MLSHLLFQVIDHIGGVEEGAYEIYTCVEKIIKQVEYTMHFSFFCSYTLNDVSVITICYLDVIQRIFFCFITNICQAKKSQVENKTQN